MRRSTLILLIVFPLAALGLAFGAGMLARAPQAEAPTAATPAAATPAPIATPAAQVPQDQAQISLSFAPVVQKTAPAVVNIFTTTVVQRPSPFANDPFFQQLFRQRPQVQSALGSGVIVSPDGLVISNNHVIEGATQIRVVLNDRREYAAKVLMADADLDLAVLRLEGARDLPALAFDDSDALQVGDLVLAIGNPFGVGQTVSSGIVSGLARSALQVGNGHGLYVQTDAPINPGNSGGALVDMKGALIGINTAILSQGGGSNGIGFAIPSNLVQAFVKQAEAGATRFQGPWAGITAQEVDAATADSLGLPQPEGVLLADLMAQSPFAKAGLRPGDVVTTLNGAPVNSPQEMNYRLAILGTGAQVQVGYVRGGAPASAAVDLTPPPEDPPRDQTTFSETFLRGVTVSRLNPAVAAEWNLPAQASGLLVVDVQGRAGRTGLQPGDLIQAVNGVAVASPDDLQMVLRQRIGQFTFDLVRGGEQVRLRFRL